MKAANKLKEGLEDRIKERVQKLKDRKAHNYFLSNPTYPENEKQKDEQQLQQAASLLEGKLPEIKTLIKAIKSYIPHIWEQNAITAVYILVCKAYGNLETIITLAKNGRNVEIVELARSGQESLDLAFLFLEEGKAERLSNWFNGKIIDNKTAREALHRVINSDKLNSTELPVYDNKTDIYGVYSLYTHSSYAALLDSVDIYHEDFDFEGIAGLHYTLEYFDSIVKQLMISLLLEIKNIFTKYKNIEAIKNTDKLLEQMGNYKASGEELKEIFERYKNEE